MKMISLKRKPEPEDVEAPRETYPWGMSLYLDTKTMDALQFPADAEVGQEMEMTIKASINSISQEETDEGVTRTARLQIIEMQSFGAEPSAAEKVYGSVDE